MASTNFSGRHAGIGVLVAFALTGCLRHEVPVTGSIKDDTPHVAKTTAKSSPPAPAKKPVKKTAAAAAKTEAATSKAATPAPAAPVAAKAAPAPVVIPAAPKAAAAPATAPTTTVPPKAATAPVVAPPAPKAAAPAAPAPVASAAPAPPPKAATVQTPTPPAAASAPAVKGATAAPAPTDARGKAVQQISEARRLFDDGKVIEARKRIMATIDAAPADANHALAQTYDPHYVAKVKGGDAGADLGRALQIYTTAVQTGSKEAEPDLARLRVSLGLAPK